MCGHLPTSALNNVASKLGFGAVRLYRHYLQPCLRHFSVTTITDACFSLANFDSYLQMRLAELLEEEGADIIQTEGGKCSSPTKPGVLGLIEKV
jgi:hypothetical protein